ncbi:MAG: thiol:disulfide interchange protein [Candidatus Neomarinimicrobiota bacterium]|nr:MAG: thiol:disulfide interchange protein [Candidatus Neomarinimicrobiota bacterium]
MKRIFTLLFVAFNVFLFAQDNIVSGRINIPENNIKAGAGTEINVILNIKEGWHINSSKVLDDYSIPTQIKLKSTNEFSLSKINYPKGKIIPISWGGNMSLYEGDVQITAILTAHDDLSVGEKSFDLEISYQACNNTTCMSPESIDLSTTIIIKDQLDKVLEEKEELNEVISEKEDIDKTKSLTDVDQINEVKEISENDGDNPFQDKNLIVVLLIVFVMGLALNLTPCVYPLIPITMGYFLAQKESKSPVLLAIMYVLGLAIMYSIIGTLAAFSGSMMGSLLAHPATLIFFAALMLALSLSMFGLYEFKLPNVLTQVSGGSRNGALGALIMGLTMGIVAAPCVGPFVVSLLGFVAQSGSVFVGFITFFVLALGLGLPYLFLGIFSEKISALPRSGEWLNGIRIFFGLALIGMSIYFILPLLSGHVAELLLPIYMIIAAVYYGVIDKAGLSVSWFSRFKVVLAMAILAAGILMLKPAPQNLNEMSWEAYSATVLQTSISEKEPVIIDFYAEWCNPCKELEHITFTDPDVQNILKDFTRLKVDLTVVNDSTNALKKEFDIPGVPTIVFYDKTGIERKDLRLNGFEKPNAFINRLKKVISE